MIFCNPPGMPIGAFRRTDKVVMKIPATNPGTDLVLYYREFAEDEALPTGPELFFIGPAWSDEASRPGRGQKPGRRPCTELTVRVHRIQLKDSISSTAV